LTTEPKVPVEVVGEHEPEGVQVAYYRHPDDFEVFFGEEKDTEDLYCVVIIPSKNRRIYQGKKATYGFYKSMQTIEKMIAVQPLVGDKVDRLRVFEFDKKLAESEPGGE